MSRLNSTHYLNRSIEEIKLEYQDGFWNDLFKLFNQKQTIITSKACDTCDVPVMYLWSHVKFKSYFIYQILIKRTPL